MTRPTVAAPERGRAAKRAILAACGPAAAAPSKAAS
jgi:hypothetical protein